METKKSIFDIINDIKKPPVEIPTTSLVAVNGDVNLKELELSVDEVDNVTAAKTKRTRRKRRTKNKPQSASEEEPRLDFRITAIPNQTAAKVFRIKNGLCCRHVHVKFSEALQAKSTVENAASSECVYEDYRKSPVSKIKNGNSLPSTSHHHSTLQSPLRGHTAVKDKGKKQQKRFVPHLSLQDALRGIQSGDLVKGVIRINAKNCREAYVNNVDRSQQDYVIQSLLDRNRALEGDVVAIRVKPKAEWTEKQRTAVVVHILQQIHSRTAVGFLHIMPDRNKQYAQFIPRDFRVPRIKILTAMCPPLFHVHPNRYENIMFKARITAWNEVKHAIGTIVDNVGVVGDLDSETAALLAENDLDVSPFTSECLRHLPQCDGIPEREFAYREDLRKECIFTIDPPTARDLDDAVSCKELENGNLEVGVHISDVAFYLAEGTPLDRAVAQKATTVYLVNNVFHMLPQELCIYCSLLPGQDKLAFSVFWEMTPEGKILKHRFRRTVINSCTQLAYEHVQQMIEKPDCEFADGELPQIHNGFTQNDLRRIVRHLQKLAMIFRTDRFERGSLRIDQTKLVFRLDEASGEPLSFNVYENKDANKLIEEFMLLANITVAQRIADDFPEVAFLRCHEAPNPRMLTDLEKGLNQCGVGVDVSSSKAIQKSIWDVRDRPDMGIIELQVLNHLLAKPMQRAKYFCAGMVENEDDFYHYALHVPIYTHFTSPIRRYADIMVHRLLSASLGYVEKPQWKQDFVSQIAANCNKQKFAAKVASDASSDLYLAHYTADHQPFIQPAVVVDVKNCSFDILIMLTGSVIRMFPNSFGDAIQYHQEQDDSKRRFVIVFPETAELPEEIYLIQLFTVVKVSLHSRMKNHKLEAKLLRPVNSQVFERMSN